MPYAECWNCGHDGAVILSGDDFVSCAKCGATGPSPDKDGQMWNLMCRMRIALPRPATFSPALESTSECEPITGTLETSECGAMPWKLQIAATLWAGMIARGGPFDLDGPDWVLGWAGSLIAVYKFAETKEGGEAVIRHAEIFADACAMIAERVRNADGASEKGGAA